MDIVKRENVNAANTLIVEGLTLTEVDNELEKYLQRFGSISRNLIIDDPGSEFHKNTLVEYAHNSAIQSLCPLLPLTLGSLSDPDVTFRVRALATVYTQTASSSATEGYVEELKAIAKGSGRPFQEVLQEELERLIETHPPNRAPTESQTAVPPPGGLISSCLTDVRVTETQSSYSKTQPRIKFLPPLPLLLKQHPKRIP